VTLLSCRGLSKTFPGTKALVDVDLDVDAGEVVALIGENGAGKSTLMKILGGVHSPDAGTMTLDGDAYVPQRPADAIAAGIGTIHQEMSLLPQLSVTENVLLGRLPTRAGGLVDRAAARETVRSNLARVGLRIDPETPVRRLSVAQQQQVEIAKALSLDARILLLDEPTASLGDEEAEALFALIADLRAQGVAFIYISHRLRELAGVCDRVVVLRDGARVAAFDRADVPVDRLVEAMVGRSVDRVFQNPPPHGEEVVLRVTELAREGVFEGVTFDLHRGEILGVAGLVGAGRTDVMRALFGADPPTSGRLEIDGRDVHLRRPEDAVRAGIVLVPEDRKGQGLVLGLSVQDNLALPSLDALTERGAVTGGALRRLATRTAERLEIRGRPTQQARTLSGGNQQKVVIGKWLERRPTVVLFDEPTRGVDVGAKAAIYEVITELAASGVACIVVSSELPEVLGLAHRVLVMSDGRQTGLLARHEADEEAVMTLAVEVAP
jgi:ribose transport system ATP-binding protein